MTTATKTRPTTDVLAALAEREQVWADAKAEASRLGSEFGVKSREAEALRDQRRRLIHDEPGLVDHTGQPAAGKDNPVKRIDSELAALGDLPDLAAQVQHARQLEERAKQATNDYVAAHLDEILSALGPEANAAVAEVARCMADLAAAAGSYLGMARRVDGLRGTDRQRQHLRVPAIDVGSDLLNFSKDAAPPPSPTEIR
jgi:hypothetical protein